MTAAYLIVTALAVLANFYSASTVFTRNPELLGNMARLNIPERQLLPLGVLKAAGALGLLAGIVVPAVGVAAGVGLVLYFVGAIVVVLRAHFYAHIPYPVIFFLLAAAAMALRLASL